MILKMKFPWNSIACRLWKSARDAVGRHRHKISVFVTTDKNMVTFICSKLQKVGWHPNQRRYEKKDITGNFVSDQNKFLSLSSNRLEQNRIFT